MADNTLKVRLLNASKTHAEWTSADPVLKKGEIVYSSDKKQIRVGDGSSKWSQLSYIDAGHIVGLSNSGSTITYTKADGSTGTITLPSYGIATASTPGLVKSGTDISVDSSGNVSVLDNSHNHTIANVTNLQTSLDAKAPKASPALTGTPTAPTATAGTNTTQIATTAFVQSAVSSGVGDVEIGGRNLFKNSATLPSSSWTYENATVSGGIASLARTTATTRIYQMPAYGYWTWEPNTQYSVSFEAKADTTATISVNPVGADSTSTNINVTTEWARYFCTFTSGTNVTNGSISFYNITNNSTIQLRKPKLEHGNKPTDWTPAPEDLVSNISLSGTTLSYSNPIGTQLGSYTLSKSNVGLGNVDNTSDANKPISTATQTALDQISSTIGNAKLFTGTCSTAAGTAEKAVTCSSFKAADLAVGNQISVLFSNTNSASAADLKLNVNGTGAKSIKYVYNDSYSNLPGVGYLKADQIYRFIYDGTYWVIDMMYNTNTTPAYLEYRNNTYAKKALTAESLIVGDKDGYEKVAANVVFDLSYPILWCTAAVAQGSNNYANMFLQHYDRNIGYIKSGYTSSAKKMIYLVVTISGNTATVDSSIITDTLPSEDDGKAYITLGRLGQQSTGANYFLFQATHPIFVFRKGSLRLYSGSADVVNGHTVETDVPSGAVFTDTKVTQSLYSQNYDLPLLMSYFANTNNGANGTNIVLRNNSIYANPSTGILTAPYLRSTHYLQAQNKVYGIASSVSSGIVDECILYTGIKFVNASFMPIIHITGYYYANAMPLDLTIVFYIYSGSIYNMGVTSAGSWQPDVYLFKYTSDSVDYIAVALRTPAVYYPTVHADILNNAVTGLASNTNINLSKFNWQFTAKDATSVIPEPDNGVTCIQVPYKANSNPKPKLTFQMAGTDSATYDGTGTATFNVTKSGIGLGNVENKSSATIRGELTANNVTTALGYTPVNVTALNGYIPYGGNDNGLGSGTTAEKAKEYFADATKIPNGKVKFYYNNSGNEYTTIFSKAPGASYGSVIKWGYSDKYFRILRYSASNWATDDWEKMDAGYADSAGYTTKLRSSIVDANNDSIDDLLMGSDITFNKVQHLNLGWASNDGLLLNIPWSATYGAQLAIDDSANWMALRTRNNATWNNWDRIVTKTYGDTLYVPLTLFKATTTTNLGINSLDKNAIGYVSGLTAENWNYQRSDGALYSQFYSANWQHQIYGDYRTGQISLRGKNNGTWQDWRRVLDESNYNTIIDATKLTIPASSGATLQYNDTDKFALQNPFAHIWHDLFAFCRVAVPTYYTTTNGTTWTEAILNKEIFAHKNQTSVAQNIISSSISGSRWVWNSGFTYSNGYWLVLGVNYSSTVAKFDVLLESSSDGTTWTTLCDSKNISCNQNYIWIKTTGSARARMRLTITRNSSSANTTELPVSSIQLMSSRPGGQGYGPEYSYPYDWDGDCNITLRGTLKLGNTVLSSVKNLTAAGNLGWSSQNNDKQILLNSNALAYWNGCYTGTSSNLAYCNKGAFGTIVTKSLSDFVPSTAKTSPDVNTLYDTGVYNMTGGSVTNTPKGYGYGQLLTMAYRKPTGNSTPDFASQLYMHNGNSATGPGNVLYYRTSIQTTWNDWQQVAHGAVNTTIGSTSQPVYMDADGTLKVTNLKLNDIAPMATKTYSGLYGSANDAAGASFYFMTVKPTTYYTIWKVKYRIHCWVPNKNYYDSYADVEIWGYQSTYSSYKIFNAHSYEGSTIRRPFYFHNLYRATQAGSSAYGHAIGLGLRAGSEPTNSAYPRTFTVELLETENCTATLFDDAVKYANLPGTGSTNYSALTEFDGYNVGLRETSDDNDTTTVRDYYEHLTAGTNGMKQYSLVMEDADGKWQSFTTTHGTATNKAKNTVGFRLGKIFYLNLSGNIAANAKNGDNVVTSHMTNLNFQYSSNCGSTLTADKPLFIKGTYNYQTGLFYLADTWWAQDFPTSEDGFIYIQVGFARSTTNYDFNNTLPTYWYKDGVVREFVPPMYVMKSGDTMTGNLRLMGTLGMYDANELIMTNTPTTHSMHLSYDIMHFSTMSPVSSDFIISSNSSDATISFESSSVENSNGTSIQLLPDDISLSSKYVNMNGTLRVTNALTSTSLLASHDAIELYDSSGIVGGIAKDNGDLKIFAANNINIQPDLYNSGFGLNVTANTSIDGILSVTNGLKDAHSVTTETADNVSVASSTVVALKTVSLTAGKYLVIYGGQFAANNSGYRCLFFTNSSDTLSNLGGRYGIRTPAVNGSITVMNGAQILKPTSTTTYGLYAYQTSGVKLASYGFFHIIRL